MSGIFVFHVSYRCGQTDIVKSNYPKFFSTTISRFYYTLWFSGQLYLSGNTDSMNAIGRNDNCNCCHSVVIIVLVTMRISWQSHMDENTCTHIQRQMHTGPLNCGTSVTIYELAASWARYGCGA